MIFFVLLIKKITARHFITRALLSAENFVQAQAILRDNGVGAGNGCSINMTFLRYIIYYATKIFTHQKYLIGKKEIDCSITLKWDRLKRD